MPRSDDRRIEQLCVARQHIGQNNIAPATGEQETPRLAARPDAFGNTAPQFAVSETTNDMASDAIAKPVGYEERKRTKKPTALDCPTFRASDSFRGASLSY